MLSDREITALRTDAQTLLTQTCVIHRATTVSNGQGGRTATWAAVGTANCFVSPMSDASDAEALSGQKIVASKRRYVTLEPATDVTVKDRIVCDSVTYEVSDVHTPRTVEALRRVEAVQVS